MWLSWSLMITEIRGSNPVIAKFNLLSVVLKIKQKEAVNGR